MDSVAPHEEGHSDDHAHPQKMPNAFVKDAKSASDKEQKMTLLEGIRLYPKAIGWSLLISTCIVMEG
jgi:SP family general alpha glucoside:H+ symporter-like MFS transporter